jgi:dihydroneopterin aldolase
VETGTFVNDSPDRVILRGLYAHGRHGVLPIERETGQTFVVDAVIEMDTRPAGRSDALDDTVDYGVLAQRLVAIVEGEPVDLLETLAQRLADACLADPRVDAAEITVHKPQAPVGVPVEDVAVTIRRMRAS